VLLPAPERPVNQRMNPLPVPFASRLVIMRMSLAVQAAFRAA
jgi:hypothetical protein